MSMFWFRRFWDAEVNLQWLHGQSMSFSTKLSYVVLQSSHTFQETHAKMRIYLAHLAQMTVSWLWLHLCLWLSGVPDEKFAAERTERYQVVLPFAEFVFIIMPHKTRSAKYTAASLAFFWAGLQRLVHVTPAPPKIIIWWRGDLSQVVNFI